MFLTQMMDLVTKMRDHLNSNTLKAEYVNHVKVKIKSAQSLYFSFIVIKFVIRSERGYGTPELQCEGQATRVKVKNYIAFSMIQLNKHINSL